MLKTNVDFDFSGMTDSEIEQCFKKHQIVLTAEEARKIQTEILQRPPTMAECILWSIQGSEHCSYKSTRHLLKQLPTDSPNLILGPKEDAGVVAVAKDKSGARYGIAMSHESHNHPSQIVPYEGAATGVGGNVRDVACMGAEVIAVADSLRFGSVDQTKTQWLHEGVVSGIAGYGNPLGVPNIAGDVYYDEAYNENCLVTVVTIGTVKEDEVIHSHAPDNAEGYELILVGKPTDNSGFGGASFASVELEEGKPNKGAVQEPNAFLGRHLIKAHYALFDYLKKENLIDKVGFKDLGAGGIACASVEIADGNNYGAKVHLEKAHTSMSDINPAVLLCSETQERYLWAVPQNLTPVILKHYNETFDLPGVSAGSMASVIGELTAGGQYQVFYNDTLLVDAKASDITQGIRYERPMSEPVLNLQEPSIPLTDDFNDILLQLLSHENIASREMITEKYDKQVQGRTVLEAGVCDSGVLQPFNDASYPEEVQQTGIALSVDHNPRYNKIDPYWGAINAVAESIRNVAAVGAVPQAITDCLCFGNPEKPEQMWQLSQSVQGIRDACKDFYLQEFPDACLPVVGGNVSLYNETKAGAIPPSPIVSCLGVIDDVSQVVTKNFKTEDACLLLIGERKNECGGSVYYQLYKQLGAELPRPNVRELARQVYALTDAIERGLILAAHDISEGGLAVAVAEMSMENLIGVEVNVPSELNVDQILFGETGGFVLEVAYEHLDEVENIFGHYHCASFQIGSTTNSKRLRMQDNIDLSVVFAKDAYKQGLREKML